MSRGVRMPDDGTDRANVAVTCIGFVMVLTVMWMADQSDGDPIHLFDNEKPASVAADLNDQHHEE